MQTTDDDKLVVENARFGERFVFGPATKGAFVFDFFVAPKSGMPMMHTHAKQTEVFRCRRGEVTVLLADGTKVLRPGDEVELAPGTFHAFENRGDVEVECEVEYRPAGRSREWLLLTNALERATGREPGLLDLAPFILDVDIFIKGPPIWMQRAIFGALRPIATLLGRRERALRLAAEMYGPAFAW